MNDDTDKTLAAEPTPNRAGRREAPIIEGEAIPDSAERPAAPAPAAARSSLPAALPGLAALILGGVALYYALNPSVAPSASPEAVTALGQRIDRLEARLGQIESRPAPALPPAPDLAPLEGRIEDARKTAEGARADAARALQQAQAAQRPVEAPKVDLAPIEQRVARLETELGPLREALTAPKTQVRATEAPDAAGGGARDAAALAVVAASLRQQIERGAPFPHEMSALEKLGADPARLNRLKPLASSGAPSAARLAQDFGALSPAMLRATRPAPADADLMDRIARSAASLVRIRPMGESAGEDPPALIGRIDAALQRGDVAGALALFDRLPGEAKEPARDWASRARQRVDAETAARGLADEALDTLARK